MLVPLNIDSKETIVRGILHPLLVSKSKNRLRQAAFLPPQRKNEFSTLRLDYTNESFCKAHTIKLAENMNKRRTRPEQQEQKYLGLAVFLASDVTEVEVEVRSIPEFEDFGICIKATPMDEDSNYRNDREVFKTDPGLPMHSDVIYDDKKFMEGGYKPNTRWRMVADIFIQKAAFHKDDNPDEQGWGGKSIKVN